MQNITLTTDQEAALSAINAFLLDPIETVFVLRGYSGCGKSTLVREVVKGMPAFLQSNKLIHPALKEYELMLTATTNKAAENLASITGMDVRTIHAFLGLRVHTDYRNNTTQLIPATGEILHDYLIFIDEASYIDSQLLELIFKKLRDCKIIFVGDPAQLVQVKAKDAPAFKINYAGAALTQVVRQAKDNPIIDLSVKFRRTVNTGEFFQFVPDGEYIQHLSRTDFIQKVISEVSKPEWEYTHSKVLTWTNKCAITFNDLIRASTKGNHRFHPGEYALCNSYTETIVANSTNLSGTGRRSVKKQGIRADSLVQILKISKDHDRHDVPGNMFTLKAHDAADAFAIFMPHKREDRAARIKLARADGSKQSMDVIEEIGRHWIDLRAAYAQTINKSQGSTYDQVFIDLDDVSKCRNPNQLARMLYVAVSRARTRVYFTGDFK